MIAFLSTWRHMGWPAATILGIAAAVILASLIALIRAYLHPEAREKRAIRRRRTARVNAMRLLRSTAERTCYRDFKGTTR